MRGERHDGQAGGRWISPQAPRQFQPVDVGQADVHQDQIGPLARQEVDGLGGGGNAGDAMSGPLQHARGERQVGGVVFNDQCEKHHLTG